MVIIFVEHFLTEKGKIFFPHWIKDVESSLNQFNGFKLISQLNDLENDKRSLLILEFESNEFLKIWTSSKEHDLKVKELGKFMTSKPKSQILAFNR
ncbi:MAG: hypothetical protein Wins2KO_22700 [Winogradskyella sp.]